MVYAVRTPVRAQVHGAYRDDPLTLCGGPVGEVVTNERGHAVPFFARAVAERCPWCHYIMWHPEAADQPSGWSSGQPGSPGSGG